jgi:hypothetical protein
LATTAGDLLRHCITQQAWAAFRHWREWIGEQTIQRCSEKMLALCVFWRNQPFAFDFSVTMYLKAGVKVMGEHESR